MSETKPASRCSVSKDDVMTDHEDPLLDHVLKMEEVDLEPDYIECDSEGNIEKIVQSEQMENCDLISQHDNEIKTSTKPNFLAELYGLEVQVEVEEIYEEVEEVIEPVENEEEDEPSSAVAPPLSPRTSPRGESYPPPCRARSRSRSPLPRVPSPDQQNPSNSAGVVIRIYDENGVDLEDRFREGGLTDNVQDSGELDEFFTPDAHPLYVSTNERMEVEESADVEVNESGVIEDRGAGDDRSEREMRARNVRGRARRGRAGRGRGRGGGGGRRHKEDEVTWAVARPLEEIWVTDDDVPLELREMAMDVVRKRKRTEQKRSTKKTKKQDSERSTRGRRKAGEEDDSESENDEYEDAIDGSTHFSWSPMDNYQIRVAQFTPERTGAVESYSTPYDAFRSYWDESILQVIVEETNRYATKIPSPSFQTEWYPTNFHEILCLFAFWMMLGIIQMPTIESCFSTNYLLKTEIFRHILTLRRYRNLVRALHFIDSDPSTDAATSNDGMATSDQIYSLRPIIDHLNAKFQANYVPSQDICIDESLTLFKGKLDFKQYMPSNAAKFGIKTLELCESATGYLWSLLVYTGSDSDFLEHDSTVSKCTSVVKKLIAPLLNKGYRLFMDKWYNSPLLARFLKRNGTECIGTLQSCCQDVPTIIKKAPLKEGQFVARHADDICVLAWQDKERVNMISTCHGTAMGLVTIPSRPPARPLSFKPQMVLDYNNSMGGVDRKDQLLEPYLLERKRCHKWYMKFFKRLLNVSILNARILLQSSTQASLDHLDFRLKLVDSILANHLFHCPKRGETVSTRSTRHTPIVAPHRVEHTHWPISIPPSASRAAMNQKGRGKCVLCKSKRGKNKVTPYKCLTCDVALCVDDCFRVYHS